MHPTSSGEASPRRGVRTWELWSAPRSLSIFALAVEALAAVATVLYLMNTTLTAVSLMRLGVLLGLAVAFEELSARIERLRVHLASYGHIDMTSVWNFAGAMLLPPGLAVALGVTICAYNWTRHERQSGMRAYRQVFGAAVVAASCLAVRAVVPFEPQSAPPHGIGVVATVLTAMVAYVAVNRALIYAAMYLAVRPDDPRALLESWQDLALEFATLCLGGLTAIALLFEPWLTFLVVPALAVLQRAVFTKQLEVAATTDAKTGLLNATSWEQLARRDLARAAREQRPASLLMIDMDNFKLVNDMHGHLVGDSVLKAVANCLTDELREYDTIGRFGGEEFVAVLAGVDLATATVISDRLLHRVRALDVATFDETGANLRGLSASIGIGCYPDHASELTDLLQVADAALYRAKANGRDQFAVAKPVSPQ